VACPPGPRAERGEGGKGFCFVKSFSIDGPKKNIGFFLFSVLRGTPKRDPPHFGGRAQAGKRGLGASTPRSRGEGCGHASPRGTGGRTCFYWAAFFPHGSGCFYFRFPPAQGGENTKRPGGPPRGGGETGNPGRCTPGGVGGWGDGHGQEVPPRVGPVRAPLAFFSHGRGKKGHPPTGAAPNGEGGGKVGGAGTRKIPASQTTKWPVNQGGGGGDPPPGPFFFHKQPPNNGTNRGGGTGRGANQGGCLPQGCLIGGGFCLGAGMRRRDPCVPEKGVACTRPRGGGNRGLGGARVEATTTQIEFSPFSFFFAILTSVVLVVGKREGTGFVCLSGTGHGGGGPASPGAGTQGRLRGERGSAGAASSQGPGARGEGGGGKTIPEGGGQKAWGGKGRLKSFPRAEM
jgi:hypothetical protein